MGRRSGLGKGLGALIPQAPPSAPGDGALRELPLDSIRPNPYQPRTRFDEEQIAELARSIAALGLLQPVLVRPLSAGSFELIAGERRWRAARMAGLTSVPALVRDVDDTASLEQAVVENVHREDLTAIEEAAAYQQLADDFGYAQEEIAQRVGRSRPAVANTLRLLQLPAGVQRLVLDRSISAGHARALLALDTPEEQEQLAAAIVRRGLSVREVEERVRRARTVGEPPAAPNGVAVRDAAVLEVEDILSDMLDTRVRVERPRRGRGRIVIEFADDGDLDRIVGLVVPASDV